MNLKKRHLIIVIFIIIINTLIYINNKQKTTFRYLIWDVQSVTLGKIINISFISGFLISIALNKYLIIKEKKTQPPVNLEEENFEYTRANNELDNEIPPERDIRDTQPTISVNYRVVKNKDNKASKYDDDSYDKSKYDDDWTETNFEW